MVLHITWYHFLVSDTRSRTQDLQELQCRIRVTRPVGGRQLFLQPSHVVSDTRSGHTVSDTESRTHGLGLTVSDSWSRTHGLGHLAFWTIDEGPKIDDNGPNGG